MPATLCRICGTPLTPGAPFCGNCGTRVELPTQQGAATFLTPPPAPPAAALWVNAPPDPYAGQYQSQPPPYSSGPPPGQYAPPSPNYASGPPPVISPDGLAPWAQPQKGQGRRTGLAVLVVVAILILSAGGGVYAFAHRLKSNITHTGSTPGTGTTPGGGTTSGGGSTPIVSGGQQTLDNINRVAIYAGVTVTILSAVEAKSVPEYTPSKPDQNEVLKIQAKLDNPVSAAVGVSNNVSVVDSAGSATGVSPYVAGTLPWPTAAQSTDTGFMIFEVRKGHKVSEWKVVLGMATEARETMPLTGAYDPSIWQETPRPIGKSVTADNVVVWTVVKVATGVWTSKGYQAPQGMRFILVNLAAENKGTIALFLGDFAPVVQYPDGQRVRIVAGCMYDGGVLGGMESKDQGYACYIAPSATGDFVLLFHNHSDGSVAGQVDLGTL